MALARRSRDTGMNYWPGFVDALSTLLLGIIFLLTVFVVVQFYLSLEKSGKLGAEDELAQVNANLLAAESERDRYKGLYEGAGSGSLDVQGKVTALSGALEAEK